MDARTKLSLLIAFNIFVLAIDKTELLLAAFLAALAAFTARRPSANYVRTAVLIIIPVVWSITIMQGLFYNELPRTVLAVIIPPSTPLLGPLTGGVYLYYQGLVYGLKQSLRAASITLAGLTAAFSTGEAEVIRLTRGFLDARVAAGIAVLLRHIPSMMEGWGNVALVKKLHRLDLSTFQMLIPLIAQTIRKAYTAALALLASGISPGRGRNTPWPLREKILSASLLTAASTIAVFKILTYLFLLNLLYIPPLKDVYWFFISQGI
jgi:energy-coupling factor transport system permease protein